MTLAMSGATAEDSGLASGLVNTTQQVGGALGLAVLATLSTSRTHDLLADGESAASALTGGYHLAFAIGAGLVVAAIVVAADRPALGAGGRRGQGVGARAGARGGRLLRGGLISHSAVESGAASGLDARYEDRSTTMAWPLQPRAPVGRRRRSLAAPGLSRTGLNELLERSEAPRGSLYHYFPGGKEQIGAEAIIARATRSPRQSPTCCAPSRRWPTRSRRSPACSPPASRRRRTSAGARSPPPRSRSRPAAADPRRGAGELRRLADATAPAPGGHRLRGRRGRAARRSHHRRPRRRADPRAGAAECRRAARGGAPAATAPATPEA